MIWTIPAKTFLLGEYAALESASAIVLTTEPCFSLSLEQSFARTNVHPESPAGRLWSDYQSKYELNWTDPYNSKGGLGASSAQFIGAYLARCFLEKKKAKFQDLLESYYHYAYKGEGIRPSGYDIMAQLSQNCVYINKDESKIECYDWSFSDISFILIHTGQKLKTHHHLESLSSLSTSTVKILANIVEDAKFALIQQDSEALIKAISDYQKKLCELNLQALHTLSLIKSLKSELKILAAKGCGALGTDVILLVVMANSREGTLEILKSKGISVIGSDENLFRGPGIFTEKT